MTEGYLEGTGNLADLSFSGPGFDSRSQPTFSCEVFFGALSHSFCLRAHYFRNVISLDTLSSDIKRFRLQRPTHNMTFISQIIAAICYAFSRKFVVTA